MDAIRAQRAEAKVRLGELVADCVIGRNPRAARRGKGNEKYIGDALLQDAIRAQRAEAKPHFYAVV